MYNPFLEKNDDFQSDSKYIEKALKGCKGDLENLIFGHQAWMYTIVLKMVFVLGTIFNVSDRSGRNANDFFQLQ